MIQISSELPLVDLVEYPVQDARSGSQLLGCRRLAAVGFHCTHPAHATTRLSRRADAVLFGVRQDSGEDRLRRHDRSARSV